MFYLNFHTLKLFNEYINLDISFSDDLSPIPSFETSALEWMRLIAPLTIYTFKNFSESQESV